MLFGCASGKPFYVWSDCQSVVNRARKIQSQRFVVTNRITDHDLWQIIEDAIRGNSSCVIRQVRSHQCRSNALAWEDWAFNHNDQADKQATIALASLGSKVLGLQKAVVEETKIRSSICQQLHAHFVRVATLAVTQEKPKQNQAPAPQESQETPVDLARVATRAAEAAPKNLHFDGFATVLTWMQSLTHPKAKVSFVSWYELMISFQLFTGGKEVTSAGTHCNWAFVDRHKPYDAKRACHLFAKYLTHIIRLTDEGFVSMHRKPHLFRFQCWTMGIHLRLADPPKRLIQDWLSLHLGDSMIEKVADLARLPRASLEVPMVPARSANFGLHRFFGR